MYLVWPTLALCAIVARAQVDTSTKTVDFYFIDAELGTSVLIVTPAGQSMLIDGGHSGNNDRDVDRDLAAMKAAGIRQIDYLVVTHYHGDHYGAIPDLAKRVRIVNWVDHGPNVEMGRSDEWYLRFQRPNLELQEAYEDARAKGNHIIAKPGEKLPIQGMDVEVITAGGKRISTPLDSAGAPNAACANIKPRDPDESEDGQSVGLLITIGKFRFIHLGDLTWNLINDVFCPNNLIGPVDVYLTTHHAMVMPKDIAQIRPAQCCSEDWSRSCCSDAELHGLSPRVAIFNVGPEYHTGATPAGWQAIHNTPGLEDIWQNHYQFQGGKENNAPEQFIANLETGKEDMGYWIKLSVSADGSFTITNTRNRYSKKYPPRKSEQQ